MTPEHIHCIGIGGIGVSALARFYTSRGWRVTGSDLARSEITDALKKERIRVCIGPHRASHIAPSVTKVIYTAAATPLRPTATEIRHRQAEYYIHDRDYNTTTRPAGLARISNPEIRDALRRSLPVRSYAEAIGELTRQFKTIAIAGAHGKSTTTAMTALIMTMAGLDPMVIIGTKLREFGNSNFRRGRGSFFVLEADEYRTSFLNYAPKIAVVTNIDREHLDFYKTIRNVETAFLKFLLRLEPDGLMVLNRDDPRLRRMAAKLDKQRRDIRVMWFSLRDPQAAKVQKILRIPGRHNVSNALAAYAVGRALRIPGRKILAALHAYRGAWRRFDYQGKFHGAKVFADYAHHPTEIKATLQAAREKFPRAHIVCVFQPHHYERTRDLFQEFVKAFDGCDEVVLLDIYEVAGREKKQQSRNVSSQNLAAVIRRRGTPALYLADCKRLRLFLTLWLRPGDVLLMMGAGSIWEMTKQLMNKS